MQEEISLERKTKEELKQIALGLGIDKISDRKKNEIIEKIEKARADAQKRSEEEEKPKKRERPSNVVEVCGVLDVMSDGFGFLRFENYSPSTQDIYVSPN